MSRLEEIKQNIFQFSIEQSNLSVAFKEWEYQGRINDLKFSTATCELCNQPELRYQFEISNRHTNVELWVGSECIKKFSGIAVTDSEGRTLAPSQAAKKIDKDKRKMILDAKSSSVLNSLVQLSWKDEEFEIESFIDYFKERGAFTPKQLSTLIWRLVKYSIPFQKSYFKCTIRRAREKQSLLEMKDWQIKKIWECLSPAQRKLLD